MDELQDFFDFSRTFKRKIIPAPFNDGRIMPTRDYERRPIAREHMGTEYVEQYVEEMREQMARMCEEAEDEAEAAAMTSVDNESIVNDDVYAKYSFSTYLATSGLPIYDVQRKIMDAVQHNQIVVIEGSTGCGKSTQVPQFILDDAMRKQKRVNIIVAQPRRIGAQSLAQRVCSERGWEIGTVVGYKIALDHEHSGDDTRLLYCTTGVLLEKLIKDKSFSSLTHIILDEIHERDKNMDFLFIVLKKLLMSTRSNTRIILMSATIDSKKFSKYFEMHRNGNFVPAPIISANRRPQFSVSEFYLDDLTKIYRSTGSFDVFQPNITDELYDVALYLITAMANFDDDGMGQKTMGQGAVLVFLPGINEITRMYTLIEHHMATAKPNWKIFVLHSNVATENQHQIFTRVPDDTRKVILSTNIAESSITVPDVRYVIDFCLSKCLMANSASGFSSLRLCWAARDNCIQRSGRAGRVMNGRCYRLIPRALYNQLEQSPQPEIVRTPLENVVLKTKLLEMGQPHQLLALAMDQPAMVDIVNTILHLKEIGSLLRTHDGKVSDCDGDLTYMGRVMAYLPLDVRISRLILLGYCFSLLRECIIIGAGLSVQGIFTNSFKGDMKNYSHKLEWANGSGSDLIAILNVYQIWSHKYNQREFGNSPEQKKNEREFGRQHSVDIRAMHNCEVLIHELEQRLKKLNIEPPQASDRVLWRDEEKIIMLKVVFSGAFYPNMFLRSSANSSKYEHNTYRRLNGRDPRNTVYFSSFEAKHIRELYGASIKELFADHVVERADLHHIKVSFDDNSEKVFVTFNQHRQREHHMAEWESHNITIPGGIATEVYKAVKMRKLRMPVTIKTMSIGDAMTLAEERGLGFVIDGVYVAKQRNMTDTDAMCHPRLQENILTGVVTHVENCDSFWFRPTREEHHIDRFLREMNPVHQSRVLLEFNDPKDVEVDAIVAAEYESRMLRGKVIQVMYGVNNRNKFEILLIDYGIKTVVSFAHLRRINPKAAYFLMPPRCFESRLVGIQPSLMLTSCNDWPPICNALLRKKTINNPDACQITIEVYSLVYGVVRAKLYVNNECINDTLVDRRMAERSEEDYMSKTNHTHRVKAVKLHEHYKDGKIEADDYADYDFDNHYTAPAPPQKDCHQRVNLRGPFSPLETTVYSPFVNSNTSTVNIDPMSVNSVLLDNVPLESAERYIVGASVTQSSEGAGQLTLRETTLMPDIRGFGPLMALLFCPMMQMKRDQFNSRYVSILTGLGYDDVKKRPLFGEHDVVLNLDVVITAQDLENINQLRYCFDSLFYTDPNEMIATNLTTEDKNKIFIKIKQVIISLLERPRLMMELHSESFNWNEFDPDELIRANEVYMERAIFPLHSLLRLKDANPKQNEKLRVHCAELHRQMHQENQVVRFINCLLCAQEFDNAVQLRIHMFSQLHLDREHQIGFNV